MLEKPEIEVLRPFLNFFVSLFAVTDEGHTV